jgi:hypothetical protein
MLHFVLQYREAIDSVTADKSLKLRKYEMDHDDWVIIEDLVAILKVCLCLLLLVSRLTIL